MNKYLVFATSLLLISAIQNPEGKRTDYYMMKNNHLLHFLSTGEVETVMTNATLANGTVLSANGEMAGKKAGKKKLDNGDCIDLDGVLQSCSTLDSLLSQKIRSKDK